MPNISAKTWSRYSTPNFDVVTSITGKSHDFVFETYSVSIKIPSQEMTSDEAIILKTRKDDGTPLEYSVSRVDVFVEVKDDVSVPQEASNTTNVIKDVFSENESADLDSTIAKYSDISMRAFLYWIDILRWSANNSSIGTGSSISIGSSSHETGFGTHLVDKETCNRIYIASTCIRVSLTKAVTDDEWDLSQNRVTDGIQLPMHIGFYHDAKESMRLNCPERAIVELALACENYLRYSVFTLLPKTLREDFVEFVEEANINQFLNRFFKKSIAPENVSEFNKIKKEVSSLFDRRNKYMHMGKAKELTRERFQRYVNATESLFEMGPGSSGNG